MTQSQDTQTPTLHTAPTHATLTSVLQVTHSVHRNVTPVVIRSIQRLAPLRPYTDELILDDASQPIPLGRIDAPKMIILVNRAGLDLSVNPTDTQRAAIDKQVVYVGPQSDPQCMIVRPWGAGQIINPAPGSEWYWRAAVAGTPVELIVVG